MLGDTTVCTYRDVSFERLITLGEVDTVDTKDKHVHIPMHMCVCMHECVQTIYKYIKYAWSQQHGTHEVMKLI